MSSNLPPVHEARRLLLAAEDAIQSKQWQVAQSDLTQMSQLPVDLPKIYDFLKGKVDLMIGNLESAEKHLESYVVNVGEKGKYYDEALELITRLEDKKALQKKIKSDSQPQPSIKHDLNWDNHQSDEDYLNTLKKLYLTQNSLKALLLRINSLLSLHSYQPGRVRLANARKGIAYQISITKGEIQIQETRYVKGAPLFQVNKLDVYGIDPIIRYGCDYHKFACWIFDPTDSVSHWLTIDRNSEAAKELAKAMTLLIKKMQKT
jgi:hypothetical protein